MSTSILDSRNNLPQNKTDRRNNKGQTETQRYASIENFALFQLKGIQSAIRNPRSAEVIIAAVRETIWLCAEQEIKRIKLEQEMRKTK